MVGQFHVYLGDHHHRGSSRGDPDAMAATRRRPAPDPAAGRPTRDLLLSMTRGAAASAFSRRCRRPPNTADARCSHLFSTVRVTPQLVRAMRNWCCWPCRLILVAVDFWLQHGFGTMQQQAAERSTRCKLCSFSRQRSSSSCSALSWPGSPLGHAAGWLRGRSALGATDGLGSRARRSCGSPWSPARGLVGRRRSRPPTPYGGSGARPYVLLVAAGPPGVTSSLTAGYQQYPVLLAEQHLQLALQGWSALINRQRAGPVANLVVGFTKWNRKREHRRGCLSARCP